MTLAGLLPRPAFLLRTILAVVGVSALSLLGYRFPGVNHAVFILLSIGLIFFAFFKFDTAVFLLFIELILSPKGYLFSIPVAGHLIGLRYVIFGIVFFAWIINTIRKKHLPYLRSPLIWATILFFLVVLITALHGWAANPHAIVFADGNGYGALFYIPIAYATLINSKRLTQLFRILISAGLAQGLVLLILAAIFSFVYYSPSLVSATRVDSSQLAQIGHLALVPEQARLTQTLALSPDRVAYRLDDSTREKPLLYRWLRDTGQAEVTYLGYKAFRVFSASVWLFVPLFLLLLVYSIRERAIRLRLLGFAYTLLFIIFLAVSYSRSLWLASAVGLLFLSVALSPPDRKSLLKGIGALALVLVAVGIFLVPARRVIQDRLSSTLHPTQDIATLDRINLYHAVSSKISEHPWIGSGFGSRVTYQVAVPLTKLTEYVQVYMFEWAYLDVVVKMGIIGAVAVFLFFGQLGWMLVQAVRRGDNRQPLAAASLATYASFLAVNITTPYLNHPLGLATVALLVGTAGCLSRTAAPWPK